MHLAIKAAGEQCGAPTAIAIDHEEILVFILGLVHSCSVFPGWGEIFGGRYMYRPSAWSGQRRHGPGESRERCTGLCVA